ncbi:zinc finger protein VAR3, chloroplastic-like isoform X2 [Rhodamnia argentea]|uniref:Zinc finger protein VAR3, chloroplastic-like isoform X2 n=1 Tax=Rhodamnia argentea TaxID=178133 RepID=A0A8B8MW73_9MYRT|nr:zinc finger protein VAR3, chloroplastic-like isoform X2 [Rhodamnia argentea]
MHKLFLTSCSRLRNHFQNLRFVTTSARSRQYTKTPNLNSELDFTDNDVLEVELKSAKPINPSPQFVPGMENNVHPTEPSKSSMMAAAQISHPWPEWVDLMVLLLKEDYFDAEGNPFQCVELGPKESNHIRTACLNFARDRYDVMRHLSKKHIQVIAECGCPSTDRKVVNSGKRLRAHVGIDEGNVCCSCNLRGNCERAFVKAREEEGGRTVDVMRILLTYGLDPISGTVENKPCLTRTVEESVRALLKQMAECGTGIVRSDLLKPTPAGDLSWPSSSEEKGHKDVPMKQGDWHCPKCNFLNFAKNIKCLRCDTFSQERLSQLQEDQDHLPLKKGDWICDKCNFLNFAKNTRCLLCKEKPPKRQLNPGEWECESCNYINFRRNMVCLKCDYRRPKASNSNGSSQWEHDVGSHHRGHGTIGDRNSMRSPRSSSQTRVANRRRERFVS